jgi:hypothetical protein
MQPPKPKVKGSVLVALLMAFSALLNSCVEAVPPAFDFQDNLIIIDALASTVPGTSYATVQQTSYEFGLYRSKAISGCSIKLINADTQEEEVFFLRAMKAMSLTPILRLTPYRVGLLKFSFLTEKPFALRSRQPQSRYL